MLVQDASNALPYEKRQVFDALAREAVERIRTQQHSDLTHSMARQPRKPVGDRMRVRE